MTQDFFPAADGPKRPRLQQIIVNDRRSLAHHLKWPPGALEVCERVGREHPDWTVSWLPENRVPGYQRDACYWARRDWPKHEVHAGDEAELVAGIRQAPPKSSWKLRPLR